MPKPTLQNLNRKTPATMSKTPINRVHWQDPSRTERHAICYPGAGAGSTWLRNATLTADTSAVTCGKCRRRRDFPATDPAPSESEAPRRVNPLPIYKRRVKGATWCQQEVCPDPNCGDQHLGGTSVFMVGPAPAHVLHYEVYDNWDFTAAVEVLGWGSVTGDVNDQRFGHAICTETFLS